MTAQGRMRGIGESRLGLSVGMSGGAKGIERGRERERGAIGGYDKNRCYHCRSEKDYLK